MTQKKDTRVKEPKEELETEGPFSGFAERLREIRRKGRPSPEQREKLKKLFKKVDQRQKENEKREMTLKKQVSVMKPKINKKRRTCDLEEALFANLPRELEEYENLTKPERMTEMEPPCEVLKKKARKRRVRVAYEAKKEIKRTNVRIGSPFVNLPKELEEFENERELPERIKKIKRALEKEEQSSRKRHVAMGP